MAINLNKGETTHESDNSVSKMLGISESRNEELVQIVIDTIQKIADEDPDNFKRANIIKKVAEALPEEMNRVETMYIGHMSMVKADQMFQILELQKLKKKAESASPDELIDILKELLS